ncbi:hypothetical protein ACP70R_043187 [Stipagrostis hirtigluma subsp. patula]
MYQETSYSPDLDSPAWLHGSIVDLGQPGWYARQVDNINMRAYLITNIQDGIQDETCICPGC